MTKKLILLSSILIATMLFVSGCDLSEEQIRNIAKDTAEDVIICEPPYMRYATGCCLDADDNQICDDDEEGREIQVVESPEEEIVEEPEEVIQEPEEEIIEETEETTQDDEDLKQIAYDLSNYPNPFIVNQGYNNLTIVLSDNNLYSDAELMIIDGLSVYATWNRDYISTNTNEVNSISELANRNTILVGTPCDNILIAEALGIEQDCDSYFDQDSGLIKLQNNGANALMLVTGSDVTMVKVSAKLLKNFDAYGLSGSSATVKGTLENPVFVPAGSEYYSKNCLEGLTEGEAIIELKDNGDNMALIITGVSKEDIKKGAKVLENYDAYGLSGSSVIVKGTLDNLEVIPEKPTQTNYDLSDYPTPFVVNGYYNNFAFVSSSSGEHASATLSILNGLLIAITVDATTGEYGSYSSLDDTEVTDITQYNAIVVGNACDNLITADLLGIK